jgi:trimeric autotransporter adhesin
MNANKRHAMVFLGSLLAAVVLSGVAAAGNPHGAAPGQAKRQSSSGTTSASASVSASASGKATARGRAKHSSTVTAGTSASGNATGVKPSSTTRFSTFAAAGSSSTKVYGNGRTAGQIAEENGAGASAMLYGPGNSQPHKAALCVTNGKLHLIDVHALKAHDAASCAAVSVSSSSSSSGSVLGSMFGSVVGSLAGSVHGKSVGAKAGARAESRASNRSGVLGASHSLRGSVSAQAKPAHAVLGAASFTG